MERLEFAVLGSLLVVAAPAALIRAAWSAGRGDVAFLLAASLLAVFAVAARDTRRGAFGLGRGGAAVASLATAAGAAWRLL